MVGVVTWGIPPPQVVEWLKWAGRWWDQEDGLADAK